MISAGASVVAGALIFWDWGDDEVQKARPAVQDPPEQKRRADPLERTRNEEEKFRVNRVEGTPLRLTIDDVSDDDADAKNAAELAAGEAANKEIEDYERNVEAFGERLERLEAELEEGRTAPEKQAMLASRIEDTLRKMTRVPAQFETRCSESVCEVSLAGEGTALDFAQSAARVILGVSSESARGPAEDSLKTKFDRSSALVAENANGRDADGTGAPDGAAADDDGAQPVRTIRYLIDIEDLRSEQPTPDAGWGRGLHSKGEAVPQSCT
jgi:hypothetical protein